MFPEGDKDITAGFFLYSKLYLTPAILTRKPWLDYTLSSLFLNYIVFVIPVHIHLPVYHINICGAFAYLVLDSLTMDFDTRLNIALNMN